MIITVLPDNIDLHRHEVSFKINTLMIGLLLHSPMNNNKNTSIVMYVQAVHEFFSKGAPLKTWVSGRVCLAAQEKQRNPEGAGQT